jgi:hypothetical protein
MAWIRTRWKVAGGLVLALSLALALAAFLYHRWEYPYGWSHCCDLGVVGALRNYAAEHGGQLPSGEATPEASLSLLYPKYANAELLRGKTVPVEIVQSILDRGELLGPDSCGWHYVEGLALSDNGRIAVLWDKAGLGHNGERRPDGVQTVVRLDLSRDHIEESRWAAFMEEQRLLLARRNRESP